MIREVKMLKDFPHPLVIKFIDAFKDQDNNAYLVLEYAEFLDLKTNMEKRFSSNLKYSDEEA